MGSERPAIRPRCMPCLAVVLATCYTIIAAPAAAHGEPIEGRPGCHWNPGGRSALHCFHRPSPEDRLRARCERLAEAALNPAHARVASRDYARLGCGRLEGKA